MIKRFLAWLKSIYFKPAAADIKTPGVLNMSEPLVDASPTVTQPVVDTAVTIQAPLAEVSGGAQTGPTAEIKAGVEDFEAALSFVESGVAQLGEAAKDELKVLAKKYL